MARLSTLVTIISNNKSTWTLYPSHVPTKFKFWPCD